MRTTDVIVGLSATFSWIRLELEKEQMDKLHQFSFGSLNSLGFEKNATVVNVSSITHILLYCVFLNQNK